MTRSSTRTLLCALAISSAAMLSFPVAAAANPDVLHYAGVNLAGAEFKPQRLPGIAFKDYTFPQPSDFSYFAGQGMNVVRLPFLWERLQPALMADFDKQQLLLLRKTVETAERHHLSIILDVHNYGRYRGKEVGSADVPDAAFADFWARLAKIFANDPHVIFGLMNEPAAIPANRWVESARTGLAAIRNVGAKNLVLVPGTYYSGAHSWMAALHGSSNADAFAGFKDPADNFAFEAHQYFDQDFSGRKTTCRSPSVGADALKGITGWLRSQGRHGFLGEFGTSSDPTCMEALRRTLAFMQQNSDVWLGWTYWAAGDWWANYPFSVQPSKTGEARPQMAVLAEFAKQATAAH